LIVLALIAQAREYKAFLPLAVTLEIEPGNGNDQGQAVQSNLLPTLVETRHMASINEFAVAPHSDNSMILKPCVCLAEIPHCQKLYLPTPLPGSGVSRHKVIVAPTANPVEQVKVCLYPDIPENSRVHATVPLLGRVRLNATPGKPSKTLMSASKALNLPRFSRLV